MKFDGIIEPLTEEIPGLRSVQKVIADNMMEAFNEEYETDEEIVYFELDNWFCGQDYPNAEPFISWMGKDYNFCFGDDAWCKENKLCIEAGPIDMSTCFCISAPISWVRENCPKLLTDEECGAEVTSQHGDGHGNWVTEKRYEPCKYSKFICKEGFGRISGWPFREYKKENFGVHWNDWYYENLQEEDDEDENEE